MVKKLFRYEFSYYLKRMFPLYLVVMGLSVLNRLLQLFETKAVSYDIAFWSSVAAVSIAVIVSFVMLVVVAVTRFYRNLFRSEGYLSMTLPVRMEDHVATKLLCALLFFVITSAVTFLAITVCTLGDVNIELWKAFGYLYRAASKELPWMPLYFVEFFLCILMAAAGTFLLFYTCMALGHLAKKNRIAVSVGIFIGYYFFCQILFTAAMILIFGVFGWDIEMLYEFLNEDENLVIQFFLLSGLLVTTVMSGLYYFITVRILKRRLNLE